MGESDPTLDIPKDDGKDIDAAKIEAEKAPKRFLLSRELYLRILVIIIVLGITFGIFAFRGRVSNLQGYGYLGAFLISLLSSATVIVPIPGIAVIFALGATYNPFIVGLAGGAGSALGEVTGYMAGYSGQIVFRKSKTYLRMEQWMRRRERSLSLFSHLCPIHSSIWQALPLGC